jgi:hypothetical protein
MALTQSHFRFGLAELAESTHGWHAAEDFGIMIAPGRAFLCRACVQNDASGASNNLVMQWQYRHTSKATGIAGDWTNITTTSAVARTGATTVFANGANCTKRLSGTGTFEASAAGCTHDGSAGGAANDIVASGNSETEIPLQIINADTAVGDLVELRVVGTSGVAFGTYSQVPSILVAASILDIQARDTTEQVSVSASVNRINGTQVTMAFVGLSPTDLADDTFTFAVGVWGTTVPGSTDPADYTVLLSGPNVLYASNGTGTKGKYTGMLIPPEYTFAVNVTQDIRRVLAKVTASKSTTWGVDAGITGDV